MTQRVNSERFCSAATFGTLHDTSWPRHRHIWPGDHAGEQTVESVGVVPKWLIDAADRRWSIDVSDMPVSKDVLVRKPSVYGFARTSYELNLG